MDLSVISVIFSPSDHAKLIGVVRLMLDRAMRHIMGMTRVLRGILIVLPSESIITDK